MTKIKFLVVFFSLGWSVYMGSFLVEAFYEIKQKNLQIYNFYKNENQITRSK